MQKRISVLPMDRRARIRAMEICRVCAQPRENCGHSKRSVESFKVVMNQPNFQNFVAIPCHFKERMNHFADKWLPVVASSNNNVLLLSSRFELFLVKREEATYLRGPYWTSFLRAHNIALNDVLTFTLLKDAEVHEDEEEDEDDEGGDEDVEYVFRVVVHGPNAQIKEFHRFDGMLPAVNPKIRGTFYRSVFEDMHVITEADMMAITFEMMKEVRKQKLLHEDEFFHLSELQYFVTRLNGIDVANNRLVMPSSFAHGYNNPRNGTALFLSLGMDDPVPGEYTIIRGNLNEIIFRNGWSIFCGMNELQVGSLIAVRVEIREECIGLFVTKIR